MREHGCWLGRWSRLKRLHRRHLQHMHESELERGTGYGQGRERRPCQRAGELERRSERAGIG
eukprot:6171924-Pleurochrysis_carterae.AAC.1